MNIERSITFSIVLALLTAGGCNDPESSGFDAIERAKAITPSLTATAPLVAPEPEPVKESDSAPKAARVIDPTLDSQDGLVIRRLITAPEVEHREPIAASSLFEPTEERIYAFVEVSNESSEARVLLVHFIGPDGRVSGGIELDIPPSVPRWRTWAHTRHAKAPGLWRVEVRSVDGALLGALPFEVEAMR